MCNDLIRIDISIGIGEYFSKCKYLHSSCFFRKKSGISGFLVVSQVRAILLFCTNTNAYTD